MVAGDGDSVCQREQPAREGGGRLRLKRVPELTFIYDESIAGQDRIEQLLRELNDSPPQRDDGDDQ